MDPELHYLSEALIAFPWTQNNSVRVFSNFLRFIVIMPSYLIVVFPSNCSTGAFLPKSYLYFSSLTYVKHAG